MLLLVPTVLSGYYHHGYIPYTRQVQSRPVVAIVHEGVYISNEINAPPRVRGYLSPDGQFLPSVTEYASGTVVPGSYAFGGVFYPGGNNDTPQRRPPVAGVVQAGTFTRNDNDIRPRAFGHLANGRFYEGSINNVPANEPGPAIPGNFAEGGVFFPDEGLPKVASPKQSNAEFPVSTGSLV